jgi:transcriptional regulator with XRE-family HTH domain
MTIAELKAFRERLGLSQEDLANHLKVARNTVSRWELGNAKIPEYLDLALETIERRFASNLNKEETIDIKLLRNLAENHPEDRGWINEILIEKGELPINSSEDDLLAIEK